MNMKTLGATVFRECLTSGGNIGEHLNTLLNAPASQPTSDMMTGAIAELLRVYQSIRAAGHLPRYEDKETDAFMHGTPNAMAATLTMKLNPVDSVWLSKYLGYVVAVVTTHREKVTFTVLEPTPPPPPAPLFVQIVGMPDRVIESKVTYDKSGNIKSTEQTESDASAGAA